MKNELSWISGQESKSISSLWKTGYSSVNHNDLITLRCMSEGVHFTYACTMQQRQVSEVPLRTSSHYDCVNKTQGARS
jgi:hypothetical protein